MRARLTDRQREQLISIYLQRGFKAVTPIALKYGIAPTTVADIARRRGHYQRPVVSEVIRSRAAMWERAIANGKVIA
jgi:hypothetical protein